MEGSGASGAVGDTTWAYSKGEGRSGSIDRWFGAGAESVVWRLRSGNPIYPSTRTRSKNNARGLIKRSFTWDDHWKATTHETNDIYIYIYIYFPTWGTSSLAKTGGTKWNMDQLQHSPSFHSGALPPASATLSVFDVFCINACIGESSSYGFWGVPAMCLKGSLNICA